MALNQSHHSANTLNHSAVAVRSRHAGFQSNRGSRPPVSVSDVVSSTLDIQATDLNATRETGRGGDVPDELEKVLTSDIDLLLGKRTTVRLATKKSKEEAKKIQLDFAAKLYELKGHLASAGRGGRWLGFLRERKISRSTADRAVERHRATIEAQANDHSTSVAPTCQEDPICALLKGLLPRLRRVLKDESSARKFAAEVVLAFSETASTSSLEQ